MSRPINNSPNPHINTRQPAPMSIPTPRTPTTMIMTMPIMLPPISATTRAHPLRGAIIIVRALQIFNVDAGIVAHAGGRGIGWETVVRGGGEETFAAGVGTGGCLEVF